MKNVRQDAWTVEDDQMLADIILRHIRDGSTQLAAFQEAGQQLGRTEAACGFRWNAVIRKQYQGQIERAKTDRRARRANAVPVQSKRLPLQNRLPVGELEESSDSVDLTWNEVLKFLRAQKAEVQMLAGRVRQLERELQGKAVEVERLSRGNRSLCAELVRSESELTLVREDYRALMQIMERARQQVFLSGQTEVEETEPYSVEEAENFGCSE